MDTNKYKYTNGKPLQARQIFHCVIENKTFVASLSRIIVL